jgi:micrococcal nuclease
MDKFDKHINPIYHYNVDVVSVYDGDTITCNIHLGFNMMLNNQKIRLFGINTPEIRGDEREKGIAIRDFLREQILNQKIELYTIKDKKGKYGRFLGIIVKNGVNINKLLIEKGYATEYMLE